MSNASAYLMSEQPRGRWMRLDTVQILKRFYFCERALILSESAWLPLIPSIEIKTELPRFAWQDAQTAHALRERVFELRFPSRVMEEEGTDAALTALFGEVKHAPSLAAFLMSLAHVLLPALRDAYRAYLEVSDPIADGPTLRFLSLALSEKEEQIRALSQWADSALAADVELRESATHWKGCMEKRLAALGGVGIEPPAPAAGLGPIPGSRPYVIPDQPARDPRFWPCRFYWPDIIDPSYPYGEGIRLQLRSAISHLNEAWAVETGGVILSAFAGVLPWEWVRDSARWTYDEARHCRMGYERLLAWGLDPSEIPLGTYIYESTQGQDPIYRLGMLFFFETKNLRYKSERARRFHGYGDSLSEHDMDFDWADETIHAGFGKRWLREILAARGQDPSDYEQIRQRCQEMVSDFVESATPEETSALKRVANELSSKCASVFSQK